VGLATIQYEQTDGRVPVPALNSRPALKSPKFHKTEKVLELFWKTSGRSWKVWNLPMWNFQQDLVTVRTCATVAIKRVEELP